MTRTAQPPDKKDLNIVKPTLLAAAASPHRCWFWCTNDPNDVVLRPDARIHLGSGSD